MVWHMVVNDEGLILAVYGEALLSEAQAKCAEIEHQTGLPVWLQSGQFADNNRPSVGQSMNPRFITKGPFGEYRKGKR